MVRIEIACDVQDPRARGKTVCHSRDKRNVEVEVKGADPRFAVKAAKTKAINAGWVRRVLRSLGNLMGWACPVCQALHEQDNAS